VKRSNKELHHPDDGLIREHAYKDERSMPL
jgi:hypothetical protein